MAEDPLISVYVPTRGRPQLVARAIASVLLQSHENLEVVVAIDGEDPATTEALRAFSSEARVRVLQLPHQSGACAARNAAIHTARGELITGLDDDDEFREQHLSRLLSAYCVGHNSFSCTTSVLRRRRSHAVRHAFEGPVSLSQLTKENVVGNQVLTRTDYLRDLGGFDEAMPAWQDYDLWLRLCERFGSGTRIDERTYIQHAEHGGERISSPERIERAYRLFVQKHAHLLDERSRASLELLKYATMHQPFGWREFQRFVQWGFARRAVAAVASDRVPLLRAGARALGSLRRPGR